MELYGLSLHRAARAYLAEAYALSCREEVEGLPVFSDASGRCYLGGYDNLYTLVSGDVASEALAAWRHGKRYVRYAFSTEHDLFGARREHYLLTVPPGTQGEERLALYKSKTRNQVRKSLALIAEVRTGERTDAFYPLYVRTVRRLGGVPRPLTWFERFEAHFGDDVQTVSAYHEGALLGANYYVRIGAYTLLLFNVSDERYWHLDVNNRLYDAYIRAAILGGARLIDFGPGLASDTSHAHFKQGFGGARRYMADQLYAPPTMRLAEALARRIARYANRARRA